MQGMASKYRIGDITLKVLGRTGEEMKMNIRLLH